MAVMTVGLGYELNESTCLQDARCAGSWRGNVVSSSKRGQCARRSIQDASVHASVNHTSMPHGLVGPTRKEVSLSVRSARAAGLDMWSVKSKLHCSEHSSITHPTFLRDNETGRRKGERFHVLQGRHMFERRLGGAGRGKRG